MSALLRHLLGLRSPAGPRGRLTILIFHRVRPATDSIFEDEPDAQSFEQIMRWVKEWFNVLALPEAAERLQRGTLPARALAITFDDGYADNEAVALPILRHLGLPATFFVATGFIGGGVMWNDAIVDAVRECRGEVLDLSELGLGIHALSSAKRRRAAIDAILAKTMHLPPERRNECVSAIVEKSGVRIDGGHMMSAAQIRNLFKEGMTIGAHTVSHPILARLNAADALKEIADSKAQLEEIIGERVDVFAYPSGRPGRDYTAEHSALVLRCGFRTAVSTAWGVATVESDPLQLPRFTPWDRSRWRFGLRLVQNLSRTNYETV